MSSDAATRIREMCEALVSSYKSADDLVTMEDILKLGYDLASAGAATALLLHDGGEASSARRVVTTRLPAYSHAAVCQGAVHYDATDIIVLQSLAAGLILQALRHHDAADIILPVEVKLSGDHDWLLRYNLVLAK